MGFYYFILLEKFLDSDVYSTNTEGKEREMTSLLHPSKCLSRTAVKIRNRGRSWNERQSTRNALKTGRIKNYQEISFQ